MTRSSARRRIGLLVRVAVALAFGLWILSRIPLDRLPDVLRETSVPLLAASLFMLTLALALRAVRWLLALAYFGLRLPVVRSLRAFALGFAGGAIVGDTVGTAGRLVEFRTDRALLPQIGFALTVDYAYEVISLAVLLGPAILILPVADWLLGVTVICLTTVLTLVFLSAFSERGSQLIGRLTAAVTRGRFDSERVAALLRRLKPSQHASLGGVSIGARMAQFAYVWFAALAVDISVPFTVIAAAVVISGVAVLVPFTFSGLGVREAGIVVLFEWLGYTAVAGLALAILVTGLMMGMRIVAALVWALLGRFERRPETSLSSSP